MEFEQELSVSSSDEMCDDPRTIIGCAIRVHRALGPGLIAVPVVCDGIRLECGYRIDILVESMVVLEIKSVDKLLPIHEAQLLTYLRLAGKQRGLIINFHVSMLKNGILRRVIGYRPETNRL